MLLHVDDRVVDLAQREIRHNDQRLEVEPRAFDLVVYLITNRDRLVTKDDLIASVWRGRIVSDSALASALNAARSALGDDGQRQRLIRTSARQGYRFVGTVTSSGSLDGEMPLIQAAEMPTLAVMPFLNLSAESDQDYFVDGLVEDIIATLTRFKSLRIIPRSSSFAWKRKSYDVKQVARQLGTRYLLEGSIRRSKEHLRVAGQLIDCATGAHLWTGRFDGAVGEVFELQDRIVTGAIGAIVPAVTAAEMERARRKPVANLDAYECFLRALSLQRRFTKESHAQAHELFYRAIELAPDFSTPYGFATHSYSTSKLQGWNFDSKSAELEVRRLTHQVAAVGQDDAWTLGAAGFSLAWICRDYDAAASFGDTAIKLNPNLAHSSIMRGAISKFSGDHPLALKQFEDAFAAMPKGTDLALAQGYCALSLIFVERFEEAAIAAAHAAAHMPNWLVGHLASAAAQAFLGNRERARQSLATVSLLNSQLRCSYLRHSFSYLRAEDGGRLAEGLRLAGLKA